ncbi:hypothetical protein ACWC2K_08930 [Streptomyces chattanoogensis]
MTNGLRPVIWLGVSGQGPFATHKTPATSRQTSGGVANLREQVDMLNCIARLVEALLHWLLPAAGRHRSAGAPPATRREDAPTGGLPSLPVRHSGPLRGEESSLVRPYVLTREEWQERRLQRGRRRALWLAVHGVDAGPRWIHGLEVVG